MPFWTKISNKNLSVSSGSLRNLLAMSLPLMLALMSGSLMFFFDRLLLAQFSLDAHNASTSAGAVVTFLQFPFICTACIAEVFVGQANGRGDKKTLSVPVWQMIWLSLFSLLFYIPIGLYAGEHIFAYSSSAHLEIDYFKYMTLSSPLFCLGAALSSFYIGLGHMRFITMTIAVSNLVNVGLAYLLIFGWEPIFPPLGISGAAIATAIAQLIQVIMLFVGFLSRGNREVYHSGKGNFDWNSFKQCIKVGLPSSLAHTIEIFAWALFFMMLANVSREHLTVVSVAQSIFFLFTFLTEGISKGSGAIAANMIGAGRGSSVWDLLKSGIKLYLIIFIGMGYFLVLYPDPLINLFIPLDTINSSELHALITTSCFWVWLFFLFDGIHWLIVGLLTAAGDTAYVLKIGSTAVWVFAFFPTYLLIVLLEYRADFAWAMIAFYGLVVSVIYMQRFRSQHWLRNSLSLLRVE